MTDLSTNDIRWVSVEEAHPRPHRRYLVRRDEHVHTVTPCYGMHAPWWVPVGIDGQEYEPVAIRDTDEWRPLSFALGEGGRDG